jgi:hypothetical protein
MWNDHDTRSCRMPEYVMRSADAGKLPPGRSQFPDQVGTAHDVNAGVYDVYPDDRDGASRAGRR